MAPVMKAESVIQFIDKVSSVPKRSTSILTFRGQRNSQWLDDPAILRGSHRIISHEYNAIRDLISIHPQEFLQDLNMFDRMVRMQHYGLPTRLLDVSSNPLVALFFATEPHKSTESPSDGKIIIYDVPKIRRKYFDSDSISCVSNLANLNDEEKKDLLDNATLSVHDFNRLKSCDRLVQFIRAEKFHFRPLVDPKDLSKAYYVTPKMQNNRIIAQHGAFLIFGLKVSRITAKPSEGNGLISKKFIEIPHGAKEKIRKELEILGIHSGTLFPDLSHAAEEIVKKYS